MLDLAQSGAVLTAALVDVPSVSRDEARLADLVEAALRRYPALVVERDGNVVLARTALGRAQRLALAGHRDTGPIAGNMPSTRSDKRLARCGPPGLKAGAARHIRWAP